MHYENTKPLLKKPPLVPGNLTPENVYFGNEMALLKTFLKATLHCSGKDDFEKAVKGFTDKEREDVAKTLGECRTMGYFPEAVIDHDIKWGIALKSDIQIELERNADRYYRRGVQAKEEGSLMGRSLDSIGKQL